MVQSWTVFLGQDEGVKVAAHWLMVKLFDATALNGFVQQVVYIYSYIQG